MSWNLTNNAGVTATLDANSETGNLIGTINLSTASGVATYPVEGDWRASRPGQSTNNFKLVGSREAATDAPEFLAACGFFNFGANVTLESIDITIVTSSSFSGSLTEQSTSLVPAS